MLIVCLGFVTCILVDEHRYLLAILTFIPIGIIGFFTLDKNKKE